MVGGINRMNLSELIDSVDELYNKSEDTFASDILYNALTQLQEHLEEYEDNHEYA